MFDGKAIISIAWYPHRPEWHELTFENGEFERVPGGVEDAASLAEALGLELSSRPGGSFEWHWRTNRA